MVICMELGVHVEGIRQELEMYPDLFSQCNRIIRISYFNLFKCASEFNIRGDVTAEI